VKQYQSLVHTSFHFSEQVNQDKGVDARQHYPSFLRKEEVVKGKKNRAREGHLSLSATAEVRVCSVYVSGRKQGKERL